MAFTAPAEDLRPRGPTTVFGDTVLGGTPMEVGRARSLGEAIVSGWQGSATGLMLRGKMPEQQVDEETPWYNRLWAGVTGVLVDLPLSAIGAVGGAAAGGAVSGPAAPLGAVVGGGAGAFAVPMALREALVEAYNGNHALSWSGVWEIAKAGLKGGGKGALLGGVTVGAGSFAARAAGTAIAPSVGAVSAQTAIRTIEGAALGAEIATLTTASAALEAKMPTWDDFMQNAILLGGMKASIHIARGMRNIYAETGKRPEQVVADAKKDPALRAALEKQALEIPEAYRPQALAERIQAAIDADPRPEMIRRNLAGGGKPPRLGESPIADPVKYERITDLDTAKGVLRHVTDMYQSEITLQTRGVVTNKATAIEGMKMISDGVLGKHLVGDAANAAEVYARAHILRGAANHTARELQKIAGIPDAQLSLEAKLEALASIERLSMLKAEFEGVGAEAGRALQIFRTIKRDSAYLGEAETLLKLAERKGRIQDIAAMAARMKDPAQMAEFARRYTQATTMEMVIEGWKAGLLTGPQTHLANILGNTVKWVVEVPENMLSASLLAINKAAHGDPLTLAQWKARAFAPIYGLQHGARESLVVAAEVWRGQGEHIEKADVYRTAIPGKTGEVVRIPFKALQVEDALFRTVAERAEAHIMAVDRAVKEGLHPWTAEGRAAIVQYTNRPELGLSAKAAGEAIARIQQAGAEAVFAQRLGPRMEIAQRAIAGHWAQFVVPFVRTPTNLVSWAVQHTPGLNLMSGRWRADFAAGGEARARAIARVTIGTGLAVSAFAAAQDGTLTGGGLFDKELSGTKRAAGWQPYSIKIGDTYYSYQRIEPVAKVLGLAADLVELTNSSKIEEDKAKAASLLVLMFGNATISTTYLSGLSGALQALTDPDRYAGNFTEQYATSLVPKIIGQTAATTDPYKREVDGVMDAIQSQIPFLREKLLPKRDVWGEPTANEKWFDVMPIAITKVSEDKVRTEAVRLQVAISDAPRFLTQSNLFKQREMRFEFTEKQRDILREVSGKRTMEILAPIVNAPDWDRLPDYVQGAIYRRAIKEAHVEAGFKALPPDSPERVALLQKFLNRIIAEHQQAETRAAERQ